MSELINNSQIRKEALKNILKQLHEGKSVDEVKAEFGKYFAHVSASEISEAEKSLILEDGISPSEIQKLCDVHAAIFEGSVEDIHRENDVAKIPGHPAYVLVEENRIIERILQTDILPHIQGGLNRAKLLEGLQALSKIELHYLKKENNIFPYLEKHGITAPPQVMWGVDDEIRAQLKEAKSLAGDKNVPDSEVVSKTEALAGKIREMIFKEENILLPMLKETFSEGEWNEIAESSREIGYMLDEVPKFAPGPAKTAGPKQVKSDDPSAEGDVRLPSGVLTVEELTAMLNTLPLDMTFVDKNDQVKYFTEGAERIFPRPRSVIGRNVANCHPPHSVHVVQKIVEDFKNGVKDHEDFWIRMKDKYVLIRYFAVRNEQGEYLGVLEVTQNIQPIQEITGEKRLLSD